MALVKLPSNAPGKWPSSMLQNLSGLHYRVPVSAFPLAVGSLLLLVTGGFIKLCYFHFCSLWKYPFIKLFPVKSFCVAICILLGLTKTLWRNYKCLPKDTGKKNPLLGSQQAFQTQHVQNKAYLSIPPIEPASLTIFPISINWDFNLLVSQAQNL